MRSFSFLLILVILFGCSDVEVPVPDAGESISYSNHPNNNLYQKAIDDYRSATSSPGGVLLVKHPDQSIWIGSSGKSNLEHSTAFRTNTPFRTGSVTKMFTAVVILKLSEQGELSLEDNLAKHLPELTGKIPHSDKITIRHLLAHLSGIIDPPNESLRYKADIINDPARLYNKTVDDLLEEYVYEKDLHFAPGSKYSYSNTNYWLLGKIIERIKKQSLHKVMSDMIFQPLQMQNTYIDRRDDENVARGYADLYSNGTLLDVSTWDNAEGNGKADGGLISTAEDLYKFMNALFNGDLIESETLKDMKRVQWNGCNSPDCEYGLGLEIWRFDSGIAYGHNGALVGIEASALFFEESGGISILYKNKGDGSKKNWLDEIMNGTN